ncbi:MAG TPA: PIN domain-containing protein [Thermodesulfovibrionales bacterium]|nr:PIN domain-containing protein [Thermodesulfovibrionales bacterium]
MSDDKVFVDTNVLVYAYDKDAGEKHWVALNIMKDLWRSGLGTISTQILQEFFVTLTKKISAPMDISVVRDTIRRLSKWDVLLIDVDTIIRATELQERYKYSFWDSLIIASAIAGGARTILSEDLADGQTLQGLTIKNPFK